MREPYPEIKPYRTGFADAGGAHRIYFEESGNPNGKPAMVLHGGPGSGCSDGNRRYFDPEAYRIILMDQRNCGRSLPHACEHNIDLSENTTHHLVNDLELVRKELGVEQWLIQGASWGSVLALVYAERFPERVSDLILLSIGTGRRSETDLMTTGLGRIFPEAWEEFASFAGSAERIIDRYAALLFDPDPAVCATAARHWCDWETAILPTTPGPSPRFEDPGFRLAFARIVTHYWRNGLWLEEGQVLRDAERLRGISGVILQGRLDLSNLSGSPWELAEKWGAELLFIESAGHEGNQEFRERLLDALDAARP